MVPVEPSSQFIWLLHWNRLRDVQTRALRHKRWRYEFAIPPIFLIVAAYYCQLETIGGLDAVVNSIFYNINCITNIFLW